MKVLQAKMYPNEGQSKVLEAILENTRLSYNASLESKINHYKKTGENLSKYDFQKSRSRTFPIPSTLQESVTDQVTIAFQRFFRKNCGFPRFKKVGRMRSITLKRYGGDYKIIDSKLRVWPHYGLGDIRIRGLQRFQVAKVGRIVKRVSGWYLQVTVVTTDKKPIKRIKQSVGIDLGIKSFLVDSNGDKIDPPKFLLKMQKGKQLSGREHERIMNRRRDFLHKLSRKYAENHLVAVEKLDVKRMVKNKFFSKYIADSAWSTFNNMLSYKLKMLGHHFIQVDPAYTSQTCSKCGRIVKKKISVRTHKCPCGYTADRDHNAARNILQLGWATASSLK